LCVGRACRAGDLEEEAVLLTALTARMLMMLISAATAISTPATRTGIPSARCSRRALLRHRDPPGHRLDRGDPAPLHPLRVTPAYQAMLEVGRPQRTIFVARYLLSRELQREITEGLNVAEAFNGANLSSTTQRRREGNALQLQRVAPRSSRCKP
jgi:hypothetical protein